MQDAGARDVHLLGTCFSDSFQPASLETSQLLQPSQESSEGSASAASTEREAHGLPPLLRLQTDEIDFGACAALAGPQYIVIPVHNESGGVWLIPCDVMHAGRSWSMSSVPHCSLQNDRDQKSAELCSCGSSIRVRSENESPSVDSWGRL